MAEDFYLTLISNSSLDTFPSNKTSSFSVNLTKPINLSGRWKVALTEIQFPQTFLNVSEGNNSIICEIKFDKKPNVRQTKRFTIPVGYYPSITAIIDALNEPITKNLESLGPEAEPVMRLIKLDPTTNEIFFNETAAYSLKESISMEFKQLVTVTKIHIEGLLALQLGIEPFVCITDVKVRHPISCNHGISKEMLVYCDLVEPQIVAHTVAEVIKIVPSIDKHKDFGDQCVREFMNRNYLPLAKKSFQTVKIDLRSLSHGELMLFAYGTASIVLHFRKN